MASLHMTNRDIVLDNEGFLMNMDDWDEQVAGKLANREGIENLDGEKMKIVSMLRKHYERHQTFPILASICMKIGSKTRDCVAQQFANPMVAWKIAGLPQPPNVFFTSFDGKHYFPNPFY